MIIKSSSIAANTPPFVNARRRRRWIEKGPVHRQLVRDVEFGRYGPGVKAADIRRDPKREYSKYNYKLICKKLKAVRLLLQNKDRCDILSNEDKAFLEFCELDREPDEAENANESTEIEEMKKEVAEMTKLLEEAEEKNSRMANEKRELLNQGESEKKRLKTENDELRAAYNDIASKQQDQEIANNQMADERDKLRIEVTQLEKATDKLEKLTDDLDKLQDEYDHIREKYDQTLNQMNILSTENKQLASEWDMLQMQCHKTGDELNELKKVYAQYVSTVHDKNDTIQKTLQLLGGYP